MGCSHAIYIVRYVVERFIKGGNTVNLFTYSSPLMIVGDFNIHVDDSTDTHAGKLLDVLTSHSLQQNVKSPTHRHGHTLDLVIMRDVVTTRLSRCYHSTRCCCPTTHSSSSIVAVWRHPTHRHPPANVMYVTGEHSTSMRSCPTRTCRHLTWSCHRLMMWSLHLSVTTQHCERCWTNTPLSS